MLAGVVRVSTITPPYSLRLSISCIAAQIDGCDRTPIMIKIIGIALPDGLRAFRACASGDVSSVTDSSPARSSPGTVLRACWSNWMRTCAVSWAMTDRNPQPKIHTAHAPNSAPRRLICKAGDNLRIAMADLLGMALVFRSSWITARAVTQIIKARSDLGKYVHNLMSVASDMSGLGSAWFVRFLNREITCCRRFGWRVYWMRSSRIVRGD